MATLTHQTCRSIPWGPWSRCLRDAGTVTTGEGRLSEQPPEAAHLYLCRCRCRLTPPLPGARRLAHGPDRHCGLGIGVRRQKEGRGEREQKSFRWLFIRRDTGGCTHTPPCPHAEVSGSQAQVHWHLQCSGGQLHQSSLPVLCILLSAFLFPASHGLLPPWLRASVGLS